MRTPRRALLGGLLCGVSLLLIAGDVLAEAPAKERWSGGAQQVTGEKRSRAFRGLRATLAPRPSNTGAKELNPFALTVRMNRIVVTTLPLPEWIEEAHYRYQLRVVSQGRHGKLVLFEATPRTERGAPPEATRLQALWHITGSLRSASAWKLITVAKHSELDGGQTLELEWPAKGKKGPPRLLRRRPFPGMNFCGLKAGTTIDQERFEASQGRFVIKLKLASLERGAQRATSYIPPSRFQQPTLQTYYTWLAATSDIRNPSSSAVTILRPLELGDRSAKTWWSEGGLNRGRGEFVSAHVSSALPLKGLRIFPGRGKDQATFDGSRRPKRLLIGLSTGKRYLVDLPDLTFGQVEARGGLLIDLPQPEATECVSVLILDAYAPRSAAPTRAKYPGRLDLERARLAHQSVAISEITPLSAVYGLPSDQAATMILSRYDALKTQRERDQLALVTAPYGKAIVKLLRERMRKEPAEKLTRSIPLLSRVPAEDAVPLLLDMFERVPVASSAYRPIKRALAAHRELASGPLLARLEALRKQSARKQVDAVRLIGRVAEAEDLKGLIPSLGKGSYRLRKERVRAIAAGGDAVIEPLIDVVTDHRDAPAGADALEALSTIGRRARRAPQKLESDTSGLRLALPKLIRRRNRMRAALTLGTLRVAGGDQTLADLLTRERDPLVRRAAVRGLSYYQTLVALLALDRALKDTSPDVRVAAIRAISKHGERKRLLDNVVKYSEREVWSSGLRAAFVIMAELDSARTRTRMEAMIADRSRRQRALLAAQALREARRGVRPSLARSLILEKPTPFPLRRKLVELLGSQRGALPRVGEAAASAEEREALRAERAKEARLGDALLSELIQSTTLATSLEPGRRAMRLRHSAIMALGRRCAYRVKPAPEKPKKGVPPVKQKPISEHRCAASTQALLFKLAKDRREHLFTRRTALRALSFNADPALQKRLEAWSKRAPGKLRGDARAAARGIGRRLDIIKVSGAVEDFSRDAERRARKLGVKPSSSP